LWLGSVARDLVRDSAAPVLLIRPDESGSREQPAVPFRRVLIPLDASSADEEAIDHVLAVANESGTEYALFHVIVPLLYLTEPPVVALVTETELEAGAERYIEAVAARLRARGISVATRVVTHTQPARAILEYAEEWGADLIAMETHARGAVERLLLGGTSDKVMRASRVPVLVHRIRVEAERSTSGAGERAVRRGES
jgi:nucleotide-binding universal stress UspA family protein